MARIDFSDLIDMKGLQNLIRKTRRLNKTYAKQMDIIRHEIDQQFAQLKK